MIIFLDFDGVLHPDAVYQAENKPLELRAPGELFMHADILIDALAPYPEVKIVLSTSWVRILGFDRTVKKMPADLAKRVTGATFHKFMRQDNYDPFSNMTRFKQIMSHINKNAVNNWLAIDDLYSGSETHLWPKDKRHLLVLTDQSFGLGSKFALNDLKNKLQEISHD